MFLIILKLFNDNTDSVAILIKSSTSKVNFIKIIKFYPFNNFTIDFTTDFNINQKIIITSKDPRVYPLSAE